MKRQKDKTLKDELPRLVGAQYTTGDQWRNNSRKNEEMQPKGKQHTVVDVTGEELKSDAVKNNIAQNVECQVPESKYIGSGQTGDSKNEHQHFTNQ